MKWPLVKRLAIIAFFLGLNVVLGARFLREAQSQVHPLLTNVLHNFGVITKHPEWVEEFVPAMDPEQIYIDPLELAANVNIRRNLDGLESLEFDAKLASAAAILLDELREDEYDLERELDQDALKNALDTVEYSYEWVSHNALVGPLSAQSVLIGWFSSSTQTDALLNPEFTQQGIATAVIVNEKLGTVGVTVQLLARPAADVPAEFSTQLPSSNSETTQTYQPKPILKAPEISNQAVFTALNAYRQSHGVHQLVENNLLCDYAQKRVGDLIVFGGLDNHAGFKKDFDETFPPQLENYPGGTIGENLAHQFCRNMTTGDSFIAESGAALIEWCFDSSTAGHREAQLNPRYNNVCVRHGENMYVVIFGE
ncbi:MAG: CAP domain-containing protein [Microgenomates group bacterium]